MRRHAIAALTMAALAGSISACGTLAGQAASNPVATQSGAVESTQSCQYLTPDGSYIASVVATGVVCETLSQGLAGDGAYWSPFQDPSALSTFTALCSLSSDSGTITVYDVSPESEPIGGSIAQGVCASEESNGWIPATAGMSR